MATLLGVIGWPIEHSRSPAMHNYAFNELHLPYHLHAFAVAPADLAEALEAFRRLKAVGLSVTIPHKETVLAHLDQLAPSAQRAGAVNCVSFDERGRATGYNTDGPGLLSWLTELNFSPQGRRAIVVGAGGSARAVAASLIEAQVGDLTLINRSPERAQALVETLGCGAAAALGSPAAAAALAEAELLVHCTPRGLQGEEPPFSLAELNRQALVLDLVYRPGGTPLVNGLQNRGQAAHDGLGLLAHQGALAWQHWFGRPGPVELLRRGLVQ